MNAKYILLSLSLCLLGASRQGLQAQGIKSDLREGFEAYSQKKYKRAERSYRKAFLQDSLSVKANLGLGNSLYKRELYDKALPYYRRAAEHGKLEAEQAAALMHNLGNALFKQKDYKQSIEAYEQALILNPNDDETRYNLVKAQKLLSKEQQPPQPQQKPEQQNDSQQQKPEQQQQQGEQPPKQDQKGQNKPKSQDAKAPPTEAEGKISKEQAEKLLEAFKQADDDTRRRVEQMKRQAEQQQNNNNKRKW
ncbi:tetratricopeptide repeat protein [Porphyromonas sp. COT-239 OH1446]|uniref:tetratricopeptide repeat protein n=1 Tax=Porphyromonas sp. COT-239 OH1446 TaxID=1515613 RepID=UPI00052CF33D|nr:tetratricopeptide repeat protein [Porphyromonas sp. COT-239 OH1446]KGN70051.1 hypothetical protein HQ37_04850 [Porphyromonas sp. COT-239 OH1446]